MAYFLCDKGTIVNKTRVMRMYKPINIEGCFDETLVTSSTSTPYRQIKGVKLVGKSKANRAVWIEGKHN